MLDSTALQTQWKAVRTDYDAIDEQWRKKKEEPAKAEEPAQPRRGIEAGKLKGMDVEATLKNGKVTDLKVLPESRKKDIVIMIFRGKKHWKNKKFWYWNRNRYTVIR